MEELAVQEIFSHSLASGAGNFFRAVYAYFCLAIRVAFFFLMKRFGRIVLTNLPPPPKDQMVHHLVLFPSFSVFVLPQEYHSQCAAHFN